MTDEPQKVDVELSGCFPWMIYIGLMSISGALYAIATAIKGLS